MPVIDDPFQPGAHVNCTCCAPTAAPSANYDTRAAVQAAVLRAVFPDASRRRNFLKAVGATTGAAALAEVFPLATAEALAQAAPGPLEKQKLTIGFIPITCASPIIMAKPLGFYAHYGLDVDVIKTTSWAIVRDKAINREYDATQMLAPMPFALTLGAGSVKQDWTIPAVENINGQAITLALKHKDRRDPKTWKGMRFAIPFPYSMHNYLLRYYLAEAGLDPDNDVTLRLVAPPDMVANLRADNIDGFLGPDPINQRAVFDGIGFIHILSRDIWDGHPCCAFAASRAFLTENPNTFLALTKALIDATAYTNKAENRVEVANAIAPTEYLNQPPVVVRQVLTGKFADGLGNIIDQPQRAGFDPFPWESFGIWILTQMKRWGQVKGDIAYAEIAKQVMLATNAEKLMRDQGLAVPAPSSKTIVVMGRTFDPAQPEAYLASFPIKR